MEGVPSEAILRALQTAGARGKGEARRARHHLSDLYELGLSGTGKRGRAARLAAKPWPAAAPTPKKRCARCSTACTLMRNSYRPCRETVASLI